MNDVVTGDALRVVVNAGDGDIVVMFKVPVLSSTMLLGNACFGGMDSNVVLTVLVGGGSEPEGGGRAGTPSCRKSLRYCNCHCLLWNRHFRNCSSHGIVLCRLYVLVHSPGIKCLTFQRLQLI